MTARVSFTGPAGTVEEVHLRDDGSWRYQTTTGYFLCDCPGQSPFWRQYVLGMVHLRDVEGQDAPPKLRRPSATHEIFVVAIDPRGDLLTAQSDVHEIARRWLQPLNVSMQVDDLTDEQAREVLELCAKGVAHGVLPAEPPLSNAVREPTWRAALDQTTEHIKLGGHPEVQA